MRKRISTGLLLALSLAGSPWCQTVTLTGVTQPNLYLVDEGGKLKSEAVLTLASDRSVQAWARISVPGQIPYLESLGSLAAGANQKTVHVLELTTAKTDVGFDIFTNAQGTGSPLASRRLEQKRIRRWKLYAGTDCHVDIGYTHYQEHLKKVLYPQYLQDAMNHIQATAAWPEESRFAYPVESAFMIYDGAMVARNADWMETLKGHLRGGRITYPASYFNYNSETMATEEMARSNYISMRHMQDMLGIAPARVAYMTDNPGLSWSMVDALLESGVKAYRLRFNDDGNWTRWDVRKYPQMFYIRGRNPANKLLVWNGPHYVNENTPIGPNFGFQGDNSEACFNQVMAWFAKLEKDGWAYDSWLSTFTDGGDNRGIPANPIQRIKGVNDLIAARGYAYPKVIHSNNQDFFEHILADYSQVVPVFKGHIESWWNLGVPSTAYETGRNNEAQDKLAAAETFATFAHLSVPGTAYPHDRLTLGWKNLLTWDEHTWGKYDRAVDEQWRWKRNTALIADGTAEEVLEKSLKALASRLPVTTWSIAVFNALSWERDDLVKVPLAELPKFFDIVDGAGAPVKYQKLEDGQALFLAEKVPGLGSRTYKVVSRDNEPVFTGSIRSTANTLENAFFRITFDSAGSVSSLLDKRSGNREWVDPTAPARLNQLQANADAFVTSATLHAKVGPLAGEMVADGFGGVQGIESMQRRIILYDNVPRIDIANTVLKAAGGDKWDFHFAFPFNVEDYTLRHEMPTGSFMPYVSSDIRDPKSEQLYTSATDQYAVNRWIDISSGQGYGVTFCPLTAPMVSYGGRRANRWDVNYNHRDPWIWSMIYNNHWFTNFQATQPGRTVFRYSLRPHGGKDWIEGGSPRFGSEQASPLRAVVIPRAQPGAADSGKVPYLAIDKNNVVLTTAKVAEANGEGIILRFNEILGRDTKVTLDLAWLNPASAVETDLVENDRGPMALEGSRLTFDIPAHGWKTVRLRRGTAPAAVTGVKTAVLADGCRIIWDASSDPKLGHYEVFRGTRSDFAAGTGSYMGTTQKNWFFDRQVIRGLSRAYYYRIRAAAGGLKGESSPSVSAASGDYVDRQAPTVPELVRVERLHGTRVSLEWKPSEDDKWVKGYEIYRNNVLVATVDPILNSHLDVVDLPWASMPYYQVAAVDSAGNRSARGPARSHDPVLPDWINIAPKATVTVSSEYSSSFSKAAVVDGISGKHETGEWAALNQSNPWVRLTWPSRQGIRAVVLHDRSNPVENASGGTLTFSDGSSLKVTGLASSGEGLMITFPWKECDWVQFQIEGGAGPNGGLAEIKVLGEDRMAVAIRNPTEGPSAWMAMPGQGGVGNSNGGRRRMRR